MQRDEKREYFDLIKILEVLYDSKKVILLFFMLSMLVGLFIAIYSPKEYKAEVVFIVNYADDSKSQLGGLASLAGLDLFGNGQAAKLPTQLYSKVLESVSFRKKILAASIQIKEYDDISYKDYYIRYHREDLISLVKRYTVGLPLLVYKVVVGKGKIKLKETEIASVSQEEKDLFERLDEQLVIDSNSLDGYIKISFTMPEALAAAQMAQSTQRLLEGIVISYELESARNQLKFVQTRFLEKKEGFEFAQNTLAFYKDKNSGLTSAVALAEISRLQDDYDIKREVYLGLAKQLEQAKIRVQKDTPVFADIQEVTIPSEKYKPRRGLIMMFVTIIGTFLGMIYLVFKKPVYELVCHLKRSSN